MTVRKRRWIIGIGIAAAAIVIGLVVGASILARRFEPYIRQQAIEYLSKRFDSDVQLAALHVRMPRISPLRLLLFHGRGALARVQGEALSLRPHGDPGEPPILRIQKFSFSVGLDTLFRTPKIVPLVTVEGMEIVIPPKGQRPHFSNNSSGSGDGSGDPSHPSVLIEQVQIQNASLELLPKDIAKTPLRFEIETVRLDSAGVGVPMKYDARLTNAKPPGQIHSTGVFGPWNTGEPGDTPLNGEYVFDHADLGVFHGISGTLTSHGKFDGRLAALNVSGEATVPDFRLKISGNPVPLSTRFEALVDGTNGDTVLKPVYATLGSTKFTTRGAVIKHEGAKRRTIDLVADMPDGDLRDVLRLAMKGPLFMEGRLTLHTKIGIPPLTGPVKEKLKLDGSFEVKQGKFLRSTIQDQIDGLSRRARGQPENREIDEVVSNMTGTFALANEVLHFSKLSFGVPGARINLNGDYNMDADTLNFLGTLKLQAKVSDTVTGWKHWALKAVDPFLSKNGAGTFLHIKVEGSSRSPKFGVDLFGKH